MSVTTINRFELNTILDSIPQCIWITDIEGNLSTFNKKAKEVFFTLTHMQLEIGKNIFDYLEDPGKSTLKNIWNKIESGDEIIEFQHELKTNIGQSLFFKFSITPIYDKENIVNICITGQDVTKEVVIEEKLKKSENDYKGLLNNNPLPVFIYDLNSYRFLESNIAATKLYGYTREEFLSMTLQDLINHEQLEDLQKELRKLKDHNILSYTTWQNFKKNGEKIYVEISAMPCSFNYKNARLAIVNDITQSKIAEEKIKRSEAQLNRAQAVAKVGSWETNLSDLKVMWSEETFRIFEIDPHNFTDTHPGFLDFVHPDEREKVETAFTESLQKQKVNSIEHRIITGKGLIKTLEERWEILLDEKGQPAKAIGTCQDITERKIADKIILDSERKYRYLTESSMDAILLTFPTGEILSANNAACKLFGLTEEEFRNTNRHDLLDVTDPELEKLLNHRSRYGSAKGELTFIRKDGSRFSGEVSSAVFKNENDKESTSMIIRDITERKLAEENIKSSEKRYRTLFEQNLFGLYSSTAEGKILQCNEAFVKMLKYSSAKELMNTNANELYYSTDDRNKFVADVLLKKKKYEHEGILKCKDGTPLYYIENTYLQNDATTGENFLEGIIINITETKLVELQLAKSNERFVHASKATSDVIWDWDLKSQELFLGERFSDLFGYMTSNNKWTFESWADLIHPEDRERVKAARLNKIINNEEENWQDEYRFLRADNSVAYVLDRGIVLKNTSGTYRMIGSMQEITNRKKDEFALQQSEARLQGIFNSQTNYIIRTDLNGLYTYYNKKFLDDYGWIHGHENLLGMFSMHSIMAYHHQKVQDVVLQCLKTPNTIFQVEIDKPGKHKDIKTTVWDFICLTNADNEPTEIQCVGIDISERKKIETSYIHSLEEKNIILETIGDGFFAVDNNWKVTYWNHHAEKGLGKTKNETIGQHLWELFPNSDNTESYIKYHQAFATKRVVHFEDYYPPLKRWYDVSAYPLHNTLSVFFKDISQRKKIEQDIRESEEIRRLVIDSAMDAIICIDISGTITVWNPQAEKIFGWSENEMIGKPLTETIMPRHHRDKHLSGMKRYQQTGEGPILRNSFQITAVNKEGKEFPIELRVTPIKQKNTEIFCAFIRDITDRKLAENLLNEMNKNLQTQAKKLVVSNEELERYAYVASHDLQEPLRMVTNFLQLLQQKYDDGLDETARKYINFAVDGADRMKILITDLLEFSKISISKQAHVSINLNDIINKTRLLLNSVINESSAELKVQFLPQVIGNESQLLQLFQNLISNAIKYTNNQKPVIEIGFTEGPEEWQFFIKDNGIGIEPKFYEKIFIIFQRLHNKTEYSGTGIGLTLCKKIVELHGGKIWVKSEKDWGSTFYFTISKFSDPDNNDTTLINNATTTS